MTEPNEQNTQQSPGLGRSIALQWLHSLKNRQAPVGMLSFLAKPQCRAGQHGFKNGSIHRVLTSALWKDSPHNGSPASSSSSSWLAAAAYACTGTRYQMNASGTMAAMTESCADMAAGDNEQGVAQSGLCLAHCQADSKSADHVAPQLPPFMPGLIGVIEPTRVVMAEVRVALRAEMEARGPPPLNILHCSFQT